MTFVDRQVKFDRVGRYGHGPKSQGGPSTAPYTSFSLVLHFEEAYAST